MMKRLLYILLVLASVSVSSCSDKEGDVELSITMKILDAPIPCSDTLSEPYGVVAHITRTSTDYPYIDDILDMLDDMDITWVRSDLDWSAVSSEPEKMDYTFFDEFFTHLNKHPNIHLLPIIVYYGNYADAQNKTLQIKEYYQNWLSYVDGIVSRYIKYCPVWEGLNEWEYWAENGEIEYIDGVKFQSDIYKTVKKYNPEAQVLSGSMMSVGNALKKITTYDAQSYYDVVNLHAYSSSSLEDNYVKRTNQLADLFKNYDFVKPLWITEFGYSTANGEYSEEEQAYLIPRNFISGFSQGISKMFLYSFRSTEYGGQDYNHEAHFGILHKDLTPKLAYYSLKNLTKMLPSGSTRPQLYNLGTIYVASWVHPQQGKIFAIWTSEGEKKVNLKIEGTPHFYLYSDIDNELVEDDLKNVEIGPGVIYVTGATDLSL